MDFDEATEEARRIGWAGDYLGAAKVLREGLEGASGQTPIWGILKYHQVLEYLEAAASLPTEVQSKLSEGDRLTEQVVSAYDRGLFADSIAAARSQLAIRRETLGQDFLPTAQGLHNLANSLWALGDYESAEPLYRETISIHERLLGDDGPDIASVFSSYATMMRGLARFGEAERLHRRALDIRRRHLGPEHADIAESLHNLADVVRETGDQHEATTLQREALLMMRSSMGDEHPWVSVLMASLGTSVANMGDYASAELLMRQGLAMMRKLLGPDHKHVSICMGRLAGILRQKGDLLGAEDVLKDAVTSLKTNLGEDNPDTTRTMGGLAQLVAARGAYAEAEAAFRECLTTMEKQVGTRHPSYAVTLTSLAGVLRHRGQNLEAEHLYQRALQTSREAHGPGHWQVGVNLGYLAEVSCENGDIKQATGFCDEALSILESSVDRTHPEVVLAIIRKAILHAWNQDSTGAERLLLDAGVRFEAARKRIELGLSRSTFGCSPYELLALGRLCMGKASEAWSAAEKGLARGLTDLMFESKDSLGGLIEEEGRETSLARELTELEREVEVLGSAAVEMREVGVQARLEAKKTRLLDAQARWSSIQKRRADAHVSEDRPIQDLDRIQATLTDTQAIIGWLHYTPSDLVQVPIPREYRAVWGYVIRSDGPVLWEQLSDGSESSQEEVGRSLHKYRGGVSNRPIIQNSTGGRELGGVLVTPLLRDLDGIQELVVIPSGGMLGVPVEALPTLDEGELIGTKFAVTYAPSATVYARVTEHRVDVADPEARRCLAIGDPPFRDADTVAMREDDWEDTNLAASGPEELLLFDADADFKDTSFPQLDEPMLVRSALGGNQELLASLRRLPGTRQEVRTVVSRHGAGSRSLVGEKATEQELRRLASNNQLREFSTIHIATHALVDDERPERSALVLSLVDLPDPLEAAISGNAVYTGLVTVNDILRTWRLNADLVTLSACDTGLGKKVPGEGYLGFAQALLQAGARCVLVSLWKVEDQSTSQLMRRFYENRLGDYEGARGPGASPPAKDHRDGMTKADALWEAKQWLRSWRDEDGRTPYAHPYYWAGFILIGERS